MLKAVIGPDMDELRALAVLRKHNGDLDKAAAELLEAEMGSAAPQDIFADLPQLEPLDAPGPGPRTPPRKSNPQPFFLMSGEGEGGSEGGVVAGGYMKTAVMTLGGSFEARGPTHRPHER